MIDVCNIMDVIFVSKEKIRNPLVAEIIRIGKKIRKKGTISARFGNRILITANHDLGELKESDFVEVVDYNILSDIAIVIGPKEPSSVLPLHWMIYRLPDINVIIHLHDMIVERIDMEQSMEVLKKLRDRKEVSDDRFGRIIVGFGIDEIGV